MTALSALAAQAIAAAATLTGKKFALMVASSLVATSGIVAAGLTSSNDLGPLAGLVGRSLAANEAPASAEPTAEPETAAEPAGGSPLPASGGGATSSGSPPAPVPTSPETTPTETEEPETTPDKSEPEPGPIQHVFVISLTSSGYEPAFGATAQMPYLATTLRPQGLLLSNYSLLDDSALANSIATVSGQRPNAQTKADCPLYSDFPPSAKANGSGIISGSGCIYPVETLSVADQLASAHFIWHAYMEGMVDPATGQPDTCVHPDPNAAEVAARSGYSSRLNPFAYLHSLLDLGDCATNDVPLTELEQDLKKVDSTPNYSYISPNLCSSGVSGQCPAGAPEGAASADAFLSLWVPKILASPAYKKDGMLIVTFGAANPPAPVDPATGIAPTAPTEPLKVGTLLLSQFLSPGSTDGAPYNPYSLLRSTEDLFGLTPLAAAGGTKVRSFAPALLGETRGD